MVSLRTKSEKKDLDDNTEVYVADTMGEMGLWYSLSKVAFIGGSLVEKGGHNPIEAAQFGTFVLHGSNIFNAKEQYEKLKKVGLCFQVTGAKEIAEQTLRLKNLSCKLDLEFDFSNNGKSALKEAFAAIKLVLDSGI